MNECFNSIHVLFISQYKKEYGKSPEIKISTKNMKSGYKMYIDIYIVVQY